MEKLSLTSTDITNLKELFQENYLIIKQIRNYERKTSNNEIKLILKKARDIHEANILIIMKLLDEKERII